MLAAQVVRCSEDMALAEAAAAGALAGVEACRCLLTVPGIGPKTAAALMTYVDISLLRSRDELASCCGAAPASSQSGTGLDSTRPGRGGSKSFKNLLMFSRNSLVGTVNRFGHYYEDCRARGMRHDKALKAVARKRIKVIYSIMGDPRAVRGAALGIGAWTRAEKIARPCGRAKHADPTQPPRRVPLDKNYGDTSSAKIKAFLEPQKVCHGKCAPRQRAWSMHFARSFPRPPLHFAPGTAPQADSSSSHGASRRKPIRPRKPFRTKPTTREADKQDSKPPVRDKHTCIPWFEAHLDSQYRATAIARAKKGGCRKLRHPPHFMTASVGFSR